MGVSRIGKRNIAVGGIDYFWYVADDFEVIDAGTDKSLTVVSGDKRFLVRCPVNQKGNGENYLIVIGKVFGGNGEWGHGRQRVVSPRWEVAGSITPVSVERLVRWASSEKENVFLDARGNRVER